MTLIREVSGRWRYSVATFDLPLQVGVRFVVDAKLLAREAEVCCRLLEWQYRVALPQEQMPNGSEAVVDLELVVEEMHPEGATVQRGRLSSDTQFFTALVTAILSFFVGAGVIYTIYLQPTHGLVFVGKYLRLGGAALILLLFLLVIPWKLGLGASPQRFRNLFFRAMLTLSGFSLCGLWLMFAALPAQFGGSEAEYAAYARALGQSMSKSYWPILVAALPWLSVSFKILGMDAAGKTVESLEKIGKHEK